MQAHRRWLRPLGVLLLLPLAGALVVSAVASTTCDWECGDQGKGLFVLVLLCTPPAAAGVLVLAATAQRRIDGARTAVDILRSVTARLVIACVVLCALLLATAAIWADVEGIHELTREPQIHTIGADEPSAFDRENARRAGIFWLVIAALLTAMTITAALALWAAWQKRRAG